MIPTLSANLDASHVAALRRVCTLAASNATAVATPAVRADGANHQMGSRGQRVERFRLRYTRPRPMRGSSPRYSANAATGEPVRWFSATRC